MTPGLRKYLKGLSDAELLKLERDSLTAMKLAEPKRETDLRAKQVYDSNVEMLANIFEVREELSYLGPRETRDGIATGLARDEVAVDGVLGDDGVDVVFTDDDIRAMDEGKLTEEDIIAARREAQS